MLDGLSLVSIRERSVDASGPFPSSCVPDIRFLEFRLVEADVGFFAGMPTVIRVLLLSDWRSRSHAQSKHVSFRPHILLCILCSSFPLGGPSENARWTLPGIHQRMIDGRPLVLLRVFDWESVHLPLCVLCSSFPLWGPFKNARWALPGIHQRMIDGHPLVSIRECSGGHQRPNSLVLC